MTSSTSATGRTTRSRDLLDVRRAETIDEIERAILLETEVFLQCGYGEMPRSLDTQSTFYLAVDEENGEFVGVMRMVAGEPQDIPALGLPLDDIWLEKLETAGHDRLCEYGALAVPQAAQARYGQAIAKLLYRAGWRHSIEVQAEFSGMVMEPRRASAMARWHGLEFEQAGPVTFYMGGDVAAHFARPADLLLRLGAVNPVLHDFMLQGFEIDLTGESAVLRPSAPSPTLRGS